MIINHPYFINNGFCEASIGSYLQLGYVPEDTGAIHQTKLLLHGYYYIIENGTIKPFCYYQYGSDKKRELLEKEGISFTDKKVRNFKEVRVYPRINKTAVRKP